MRTVLYLFFAGILTLSGCAVKAKPAGGRIKPGSSSGYSKEKYLAATGIGQSENEARRQAKAELSNIFESKVFSDVTSKVRSAMEGSGDEKVTRDAEHSIRVVSDVEMKGVEIIQTWHDDRQGLYYAVAALERDMARREWQGEIDSIDSEIGASLISTESSKSRFTRFTTLKEALRAWYKREVFVSRLSVLGYRAVSSAGYDMREIYRELYEIKAKMLIFAEIKGDRTSAVSGAVAAALGDEGYLVSDSENDANVLLKGSVRVDRVDIKNSGWEFARATVFVTIVDRGTGLTVGEITGDKRGSHLTYDEAVNKALNGVSSAISKKITEYFGIGE